MAEVEAEVEAELPDEFVDEVQSSGALAYDSLGCRAFLIADIP